MQTTYESLRTFISSPKDVSAEREIAVKVLHKVSNTFKDSLGFGLEPVDWNDFVPQTTKLPEETIQDILNDEIAKCKIFILILWKRYGSKEARQKISNTEREVKIALDILKKEKKIMFLSYFRNLSSNNDPGAQEQTVLKFRQELQDEGIWYKSYDNPNEFQELLTHDLFKTILRYRLSTRKNRALRKFWIFGTPDRPTHPHLAICYPSMERTFMGPDDGPSVWLNRLEPNIVFEDFKALQKLDKTLRLIGFRNFRIFNSSNLPADLRFMSRFWICLPRNNPGLEHAKQYQKVSKFTIVRRPNRTKSFIKWKPCLEKDDHIVIHSPLAKYLHEQRSKLDISGGWHREMDNIIAKDYAILARFHDDSSDVTMQDGLLQDYFLAGLRGLGTWGAGWFIDRKYQLFDSLPEKQNVQLLLEVEFRDGRIYNVRDVSDKPRDYFKRENSMATIKKNIKTYLL